LKFKVFSSLPLISKTDEDLGGAPVYDFWLISKAWRFLYTAGVGAGSNGINTGELGIVYHSEILMPAPQLSIMKLISVLLAAGSVGATIINSTGSVLVTENATATIKNGSSVANPSAFATTIEVNLQRTSSRQLQVPN